MPIMSSVPLWLADLPLLLIVLAGWQPCSSLRRESEWLERGAACLLLGAAALLLSHAIGGPEGLLDHGPRHLAVASGLALMPHIVRSPRLRATSIRMVRHAGGLLLMLLAGGWTFGQNALSA